MIAAERARVRFVFGGLALVPLFLTGWLGYVQVLQAAELPRGTRAALRLVTATADREGARVESVPQPRGSIVDREGNLLAVDREVYEVRARISVPPKRQKTVLGYLEYLAGVADAFARAMVADPQLANRSHDEIVHREAFAKLLAKEFGTPALATVADPATAKLPTGQCLVADVRLAAAIDSLPVVEALRALDEDSDFVAIDFLRGFERAYPERALTYGLVGHVDTAWQAEPGQQKKVLSTFGVCGIESFAALDPAPVELRAFRQDGKGRPYFQAPVARASKPNVVHASLDLDLQRVAQRELGAQVEAVTGDGKATPPKWGALVLVEIETGDVLAAASWQRDQKVDQGAAWTPYQSRYEPGSIVKPLVLAYAYEAGVLDWSKPYDCSPHSQDYRERIASLGRAKGVRDDHDCPVLDAHGILVNSSNIGAAYIGLGLDREQWRDYLSHYGFGTSLGLQLPNEPHTGANRRSFLPGVPIRSFRANSAISFSFGYELEVTAMQMARAYLRLFRGAASELRICRGVEVDGEWLPVPVSPTGAKFSPHVLEAVRQAMVDVVSNDPHATGFKLHHDMLEELGIDLHGVIGGKTGTAVSRPGTKGGGKVESRNASFVGFLPAESPRWLAVGVLQKDSSAKFYGGSYAAPMVVRLLLQAQRLAERRLLRQELQVGRDGQVPAIHAAPVDSGWGRGAPETTSVGR